MGWGSEFLEEELNTGVGWGRGQIKVGVVVRLRLGSGRALTSMFIGPLTGP